MPYIGMALLQIYLDINIANQFIKFKKKTKRIRKLTTKAKRNHHVR